jgi:hypothetical protein
MMKPAFAALLLITAPAMAADKKAVTIQTPSGEITFKEVTIPDQKNFKDTVTELTQDERAALKRDTERVPHFIAAFVPPNLRKNDVLEDLDLAFAAWLKSGKRDAFPSKDVIRIVGCGFGAHAIQHLGVRWARITDAKGSDIALVAEKPMTRSYPFTSVQYRIEDNKTDFIVALFRSLEHNMKENSK